MSISQIRSLLYRRILVKDFGSDNILKMTRHNITTRSGAILPEPKTQPFGFFSVICAVPLGLMIGATISKHIASFLEENDLFVPTDDDDDDD